MRVSTAISSILLLLTLVATAAGQTVDSDSDGIPDEEERTIYNTDPNNVDTDGDGISDGDEIRKTNTNPRQRDSDFDTVSDYDEINKYGTDPLKSDTDGDGRSDGQEILVDSTDPKVVDGPGVAGARPSDAPRPVPATNRRDSARSVPANQRRTPITVSCTLDSMELFYPAGGSSISVQSNPDNVDKLNGLLDCMRRCPAMTIAVEGNASTDGASARNQRLSDKRADAVADYLISKGIEMRRIIRTYGLGERSPKIAEGLMRTPTQRRAAQMQNRRVVIIVTKRCQ